MPGTAGLEHRIGGLEKGEGHGNISYDPANHDFMVRTRAAKVERIAQDIPPLEVDDPGAEPRGARCWCSAGGRRTARSAPPSAQVRNAGLQVAQAHLRHLNPFPSDLGDVLQAVRRGDGARDEPRPAVMLLRAKYLVDVVGYNHVRGLPLRAAELADAITDLITATGDRSSPSRPTEEALR